MWQNGVLLSVFGVPKLTLWVPIITIYLISPKKTLTLWEAFRPTKLLILGHFAVFGHSCPDFKVGNAIFFKIKVETLLPGLLNCLSAPHQQILAKSAPQKARNRDKSS